MPSKNIFVKTDKLGQKGVFAKTKIDKNGIIWKLDRTEKVLTKSERDELPQEIRKLAFQYKKGYVVVSDNSKYMNHSCDPNTWWRDDETLVAKREIKNGEEITYDYSTADVGEWVASWECQCGSLYCRHKITGKDCLDKDFQERYEGHLPSWVLTFIKGNKTIS